MNIEEANKKIEQIVKKTVDVILSCQTMEQMITANNFYRLVPFYLQNWLIKNNVNIDDSDFHKALDYLESFLLDRYKKMGNSDIRFANLIKWADKQREMYG